MYYTNTLRCFTAAVFAAGLAASTAFGSPAFARTPPPQAATATRGTVSIQRGFNLDCYNAIPLTVFVDGKPVSAIAAGHTLKLRVLPGHYRVGIALGHDYLAGVTLHRVALNVAAGSSAKLFASLGAGGSALRMLGH